VCNASVEELRSQGGKLIDRVLAGECITVTPNGTSVAELRGLPRRRLGAAELIDASSSPPRSSQAACGPTWTPQLPKRCGWTAERSRERRSERWLRWCVYA